jgi:hypothetical protein
MSKILPSNFVLDCEQHSMPQKRSYDQQANKQNPIESRTAAVERLRDPIGDVGEKSFSVVHVAYPSLRFERFQRKPFGFRKRGA